MEQESKRCIHCLIRKPLDYFNKDNRRADGRDGTCKQCRKEKRMLNKQFQPKRRDDAVYKCDICLEKKTLDHYKIFGSGARNRRCNQCLEESNIYRSYTQFENQFKKTKAYKLFVDNLRKVTGIYKPEDLITKHRKWS